MDEATFFWEKRSKNYFCNNGGFKILFRPFSTRISEHVAQFQHSGGPSGKVGPPFKLTFLARELPECSRCIIQPRNGWINLIEIGPKVYVR